MAWTFEITNGKIIDPSGVYSAPAYAGLGHGKNDPADEAIVGVGPLPEGEYLEGPFFDDPGGKGPLVCRLYPMPGTDTHGRSGFMIHGDSKEHPGQASHGCIVTDYETRLRMSQSSDKIVRVIVGEVVEA